VGCAAPLLSFDVEYMGSPVNIILCKNSPAIKKGEAKNAQVTDFGV